MKTSPHPEAPAAAPARCRPRQDPPAENRDRRRPGSIELVRQRASPDDPILRTHALAGPRADARVVLWRIASDPPCFRSLEAARTGVHPNIIDSACATARIGAIRAQLANMP